ncbi:MAG: 6-pyruvoyl-tetrahydropterin synthase-related protein [Patescibacteria group bacterium]
MLETIKKNSKLVFLILIVLVSVPAIFNLLQPGFPLTDDGNWMVIRFSSFYESLKAGQFPVRFLMRLNNGYGYPVADFLYPLFMYLATPFQVLGIGFVNSIKAVIILSLVLSSLFSFLWLRKKFDNLSSFVGSFFYTYFPYHLFDVYKRGSVGEVLSLAILPFVFWQIERKSLFWISVGIAFLILAHNSLAALFIPIIILYMVINLILEKEKETFLRYLKGLIFGFGMSLFFTLPAILDLKYTVFSKTSVSDFSQYFSSINLIGFAPFLIIITTLILIFTKKINLKTQKLVSLFLLLSIVSIFLSVSVSSFIWEKIPVSFIQFPFRFLSLTILSVSFLAALVINVLPKKQKIFMAILFLILLFMYAYPQLKVSSYQNYPESFYSTNQDTTTVKNEYMPIWVKNVPTSMYSQKVDNLDGQELINLVSSMPNKTLFNTYLTKEREIEVNTVYFPGWEAYVNNKKVNINYYNDKGTIRLNLNKGQNDVRVEFKETNIRNFSNLISLMFIIGLIIMSLRKRLLKRK